MASIIVRGIREAFELFDRTAGRLEGDAGIFEELVDDVLRLEEEWYASLGDGSWGGLDLEVSGELREAVTRRGAAGQRIDVQDMRLTFGLDAAGDGPGLYGGILAARGLSVIAEPTDQDAEDFAEDFLLALTGEAR
jgi:hypothetical protein